MFFAECRHANILIYVNMYSILRKKKKRDFRLEAHTLIWYQSPIRTYSTRSTSDRPNICPADPCPNISRSMARRVIISKGRIRDNVPHRKLNRILSDIYIRYVPFHLLSIRMFFVYIKAKPKAKCEKDI